MALFGLGGQAVKPQAQASESADMFDVGLADFEEKVIKGSLVKPVLVDFWAPWCGPCKQLMPVLEQAVREAKGSVVLAKVNIDENPELAQAMRVQSVPTVLAFFGGHPVTGFAGARPASEVKALIEQLMKVANQNQPEALDIPATLKLAAEALAQGDLSTAQGLYAQILDQDEKNIEAYAGLVRTFIAAGQIDQAEALIKSAPETIAKSPQFEPAKTALELAKITPAGSSKDLSEKLLHNPDDLQTRYDLAQVEFLQGRREQAINNLMEIVRRKRDWNEDSARLQLLKFFEAMGPADPLTAQGRKNLSRILFS